MAIETNLNQSPYFDDYNENKNFHRVLFRPGYAVQARELTQLQSILQNQIERFANEVVVDGTIITGGGLITDNTNYVKLRDKDANTRVVLLADFFSGGKIANVTITGVTSGMTAKLVDAKEGSEAADTDNLTLYCHYTNSGANNTTRAFIDNEELDFKWSANNAHKFFANTIASGATGKALKANISDGIIYHKGNFVRLDAQSIIVGKYTTTPNAYIGITTTETLVDSNQDATLLDNASGSTNYAAPGANRLKLTPTLSVKDYGYANTDSYFTVAVVESGSIVQKNEDTTYSDFGKYVAERMYDANGNFVIRPFNLRVREHLKKENSLGRYTSANGGDAAKLVVEIEKGEGYVNGDKVELMASRFLNVDKAANTIVKDSLTVGQAFGNYAKIKEVVGQWDIQGLREVKLYDTAQKAISGKNLGLQGATGSYIGKAKIRGFQYDSGTQGKYNAVYRLYMFDVQMVAGKSFSEVRGVYVNNTSGPKAMGDIVLDGGVAKIYEPGLNTLVFPLGQRATKTLLDADDNRDTRFVYRTEREASFDVDGEASISLSSNTAHTGGSEVPWDTGSPITDTSEKLNYVVVAKTATYTEPHYGNIISASGNTVYGDANAQFATTYQVGDYITFGSDTGVFERITAITSNTELAIANNTSVSDFSGANGYHRTVFPIGHHFDLSSNGTITSTTSPATVDIDLQRHTLAQTFTASVAFNVYRTNAVQTAKAVRKNYYVNLDLTSHSAGATGPWSLGVSDVYKIVAVYKGTSSGVTASDTDVTSHFELETGQKDAFYDNAKLVLKADSSLDLSGNVGLLVKFNYFTHSRTQGIGYLSVDSYPTSNTDPIPSDAIAWQEIPVFKSPSTGKEYDLRDHIDVRPIKQNTVTPTQVATVAGSPTNPAQANSQLMSIDSDGAYMVTPDENFVCDAQFYLPRKDRVVITKGGAFEVIKGVSDPTPLTPPEFAGSMTLGTLDIPPFPSLSPYVAKQFKRSDYAVKLELENNRRYTMKDLRAVENRIRNLEYYSTLNLLENATQNKQLFDGNGSERFKNGFFVDDMGSHVNSDTKNKYYRAAIDRVNGVMRPTFSRSDLALKKDVSFTSSNVTKTGDLITLDYTHKSFIDQPYASKLRNPVQELMFNWRGQITLSPQADNTPDITQLPDVQLDFSGFYDAIEQLAQETGLTTGQIDWGNWNVIDSGRNDNLKRRNIAGGLGGGAIRERIGITTTLQSVTETISMGNSIENISTREYMRSREIRFTGVRMKPNTRVWAYFDDEAVDAYCTPTNSSFVDTGVEGDNLVTDSSGNIYGTFRIPDDSNLRFRVGTKRFVLKDTANPVTEKDLVTTSAHGDYTSNPLEITMRGTAVNMQMPQFAQETVVQNQTLHTVADGDRAWWDPIAQTFSVNVSGTGVDGVYITKMDLFFGKVDTALPITLQIREVVNGMPTEVIVPHGVKTMQLSNSNISSDASVATTFTFDTPVFLRNQTDYCFVVVPAGNSDQFAVWTAKMGGTDVFRPNTLINKQTASGVLFSSSNDKTWSPIQDEDIKFTMYRADFETNGTVYIENDEQDYFSIDNLDGQFKIGESVRSESVLTFSNNDSISVGTVLKSRHAANGSAQNHSFFANGVVRQIVTSGSGSVTVKVDGLGTFSTASASNTYNLYTGANTWIGNTTSFSANSATGKVTFADHLNGKLYVNASTGGFANGYVRGQKSGASARVTTVDNIVLNTLVPKIPEMRHAKTNIGWSVRTTSTSGTISTDWETIKVGQDNHFYDGEKKVYSKTNESSLTAVNGSKKSLVIRGKFSSTNPAVSPVIDASRLNGIVLGNIINNSYSTETGNYGNALVRYISRKVELADGQDAEDMTVFLDAFKPSGTDIKVYAKIINAEDGDNFDDKEYTLLRQVTAANTVSSGFDGSDVKEFEYTFSANTNGQNFLANTSLNQAYLNTGNNNVVSYQSSDGSVYHGYKTFAIKIVLTAQGTNLVPTVDDLRAICLQK